MRRGGPLREPAPQRAMSYSTVSGAWSLKRVASWMEAPRAACASPAVAIS